MSRVGSARIRNLSAAITRMVPQATDAAYSVPGARPQKPKNSVYFPYGGHDLFQQPNSNKKSLEAVAELGSNG